MASDILMYQPTLVPVAGSDYTINHDKYAPQVHTGSGATFNLPGAPIKAGSLSMDVPLTIGGWTHTYRLRDNGSGAMSAPGFSATLSQARTAIEDSAVSSSGGGTVTSVGAVAYLGGYTNSSSGASEDSSFALNETEKTVTVVAGGISATIDYVTGAVVFDLTTATGVKDTISTKAVASGSTQASINLTSGRG